MFSIAEKIEIAQYAYNYGFERSLQETENGLIVSSARYSVTLILSSCINSYELKSSRDDIQRELEHDFATFVDSETLKIPKNQSYLLADVFLRTSQLAQALPNQALRAYQKEISTLDDNPLSKTETLAIVKQRIGQQKYRAAMIEYWEGKCAVTGAAIPELLRASHAKPWAECETDAERLDVYNGFLLSANLDALFDQFLISFDEQGQIIFSKKLTSTDLEILHIHPELKLRSIVERHFPYLEWHRRRL
jgi:putative restriction endonuclease